MEELNFKQFVENTEKREFESDVRKTLLKIPNSHRNLVKKYDFESEGGNTLKGDKGHVGVIDEKKLKIKVAAPYNYGREFTILHEVAHAVYKYVVDHQLKKTWVKLVKDYKKQPRINKEGLDQNEEEIFCMIYAQHYAKNKIVKFDHPHLESFIKALPK